MQFNGLSTHSPVNVAYSRDGARTFSAPVQVSAGTVRNNQDARIVSAPDVTLFLTFDNGVQSGKGSVIYASMSTDGGATWSTPVLAATFQNPACTYPTYCFDISGVPFRSGGSYPASAFDPVRNRLYVIYPDIVGSYAQIYFISAPPGLSAFSAPRAIAPAGSDRFQNEIAVASNGRIDVSFFTSPRPVSPSIAWDVPGDNYRGQGIWLRYTDGGKNFSAYEDAHLVPAALAVSPPALTALTDRNSDQLLRRLALQRGCQNFSMQLSSSAAWLEAHVAGNAIDVNIDPRGLGVGTYNATLTITPVAARDVPAVNVPVQLTVVEQLRMLDLPFLRR